MPRPKRDLHNLVFGRLTVLSPAPPGPKGLSRWHCLCGCGQATIVRAAELLSGHTHSCGCLKRQVAAAARRKHGHAPRVNGRGTTTTEYRSWASMLSRCTNPRATRYAYYGGRGIKVCDRWRHDFAAFFADMGPKPSSRHSLDRINNDGDYEPSNCRWATQSDQVKNSRRHLPRS